MNKDQSVWEKTCQAYNENCMPIHALDSFQKKTYELRISFPFPFDLPVYDCLIRLHTMFFLDATLYGG
jgi:hypothetical protein